VASTYASLSLCKSNPLRQPPLRRANSKYWKAELTELSTSARDAIFEVTLPQISSEPELQPGNARFLTMVAWQLLALGLQYFDE
jgi:hypothetical protein